MAQIVEKWPDMSTLPEWANEAIESGQLFNECFKRINHYKAALEDIRDLAVSYDGFTTHNGLKSLIDDMSNVAVAGIGLKKWTEKA